MAGFFQYIKDTRREMSHVSWPTRTQTIGFTIMVVIISILVALYLSVFDVIFTRGLQAALEHAPRFSNVFNAAPVIDVDVASSTAATSSDIIITPVTEEE